MGPFFFFGPPLAETKQPASSELTSFMSFAFEKLHGLDRERLIAAIEPVLRAHRVEGVELIWRTDNRGWVLILTVERAGHRRPGAGVTLDQCSELSRDLSTALDVADVIGAAYRLEVGTPGVERQLYRVGDYERFAGQRARLKLKQPVDGQWTLIGSLHGVEPDQRISIETDAGIFTVAHDEIASAHLVFDPNLGKGSKGPAKRKSKPRKASPPSPKGQA